MTMGKNMEERQKRHKNLIISGIAEKDITVETDSKPLKHTVFCMCSRIEPRLRNRDILSCKRIGRIDITCCSVVVAHIYPPVTGQRQTLSCWTIRTLFITRTTL